MSEALDFSGFSCPQVGLGDDVLDVVAVGHARQVVETYLERHRAHLDRHAAGLSTVLTAWLTREDERFDTVWNLAFGDAHALLLSHADDVVRCASALALRMNERGHAGAWEAELPAPARLRFGRWLLPAAEAIQVSAAAENAAVRTRAAGEWRSAAFLRDGERGWALVDGDDVDVLATCQRPDFRFTLSTAQSLSPSGAERLLQADAYQFDRAEVSTADAWRATCDAAVDLIRETADFYATWVDRVLRDLIPLRARPSTFNSGSERFSPGVVCVSDQPFRWPLAEMLVHEATHQYLHIITRLGPLDDGTDQSLYFSPFRNKERPIFFIVVAYHAFANVLMFYRTARERGLVPERVITSEAFASREETLTKQLRAIEDPLKNARSLTPLGRALWEPLYNVLHA
ncbi:HEXXH motif-containing putative peptide modification protein [Sorangium sp. So ce295]|jgi:HEXXH motif-containing protein|uniref:aKG-HExxH-type peptide beta-hydroxylase n=1 Tax=Sorangium sp. So ce295 TaxID=3133295 RepID=UPI003F6263C3